MARLIDADALLDGLDENCGDLDLHYNSEYAKLVHYIILTSSPPSTLNLCGMGGGAHRRLSDMMACVSYMPDRVQNVGTKTKVLLRDTSPTAARRWTEVRKMVDWGWLVVAFFAGQWTMVIGVALLVWVTYRK